MRPSSRSPRDAARRFANRPRFSARNRSEPHHPRAPRRGRPIRSIWLRKPRPKPTAPTGLVEPAGGRAGSRARLERARLLARCFRSEPMRSGWVERDAAALVDHYAKQGVAADLALRVYSTRLLGHDPKLVLHGGGNTSVKTRMLDFLGEEAAVLCVKGSGWDMAWIEPAGLPAVRLDPLHRLRSRDALPDEEMVRIQRSLLIDPMAPNPSVETLLHAFLPHKFVDHTHASAVLSLADQPDGAALCRDIYDGRVGLVPYRMPGFSLAKAAGETYDADPQVEALILIKHGIFTF